MMNIKFINADSVELIDSTTSAAALTSKIQYTIGESQGSPVFTCNLDSFSKNEQNYYHFAITGTNVQLSGSIGDVTEGYQYWNLFKGQTAITNASNLTLDATTLKDWCYANMFLDCTNLTTPPIISGTSLARWCCQGMFAGCNSLTAAPTLPATTLAQNCYYAMFYGCKSLSASPYLPATTLVPWCYTSMFYNCQNLTSISANFTSWRDDLSGNPTKNWVVGIDTEGEFYNNNVDFIYGESNIPESWQPDYSTTPLTFKSTGNTAVAINKTNLSCNINNGGWNSYDRNYVILSDGDQVAFSGTNSKVKTNFMTSGNGTLKVFGTPYSLTNFEFAGGGYINLFENCTQIKDARNLSLHAKEIRQSYIDDGTYFAMFSGCTGLTAAPELPATKLAPYCYGYMFGGCTSLSTAPALPATEVIEYCYVNMFSGCSSLTSINIAASGIANSHYVSSTCENMFTYCSHLSSIEVNFTEWEQQGISNWVQGVAANGTFTKPNALLAYSGASYIPQGWNVVNK